MQTVPNQQALHRQTPTLPNQDAAIPAIQQIHELRSEEIFDDDGKSWSLLTSAIVRIMLPHEIESRGAAHLDW
jgi:hypothetical protein